MRQCSQSKLFAQNNDINIFIINHQYQVKPDKQACHKHGRQINQNDSHRVVLFISFILRRGSEESGQRRMQGANTIARALADIRL